MDLLGIQIRAILGIGFAVLVLIQAGTLIVFWKSIQLWQKCYALGVIMIMSYVVYAMRSSVLKEIGLNWGLLPLGLGFGLLVACAFVPFTRRRREHDKLNAAFPEKDRD